jgi:WD40 repeat protein
LIISSDGKLLISYNQNNFVNIYNISKIPLVNNNKALLKSLQIPDDYRITNMLYFNRSDSNKSLSNISVVPYLMLSTSKGLLYELNLKSGEMTSSLKVFNQGITKIKFNHYNQSILAISEDQCFASIDVTNIDESDVENCNIQNIFPAYCQEILDIKVTSSSNFLFSSNDLGLKYYDLEKKSTQIIEGHKDFIMHIEYKNGFVVTSSKDSTLRLYKEYVNKSYSSKFKCIFSIKGHTEAVTNSALITKNNSIIVCSGGKDKSIKLWDLTEKYNFIISEILERSPDDYYNFIEEFDKTKVMIVKQSDWSELCHDDEISFIKISPNDKLIATASADKSCKIWEKSQNKNSLELLFELKGHTRAFNDLSFSRINKLAATGSTDKTIKIWNLENGSCISTLTGHLASVTRVEWVYLGTHILSSGSDGLVKLWNLKTNENLVTISCHDGKIFGLSIIKPKLIDLKECSIENVFAIKNSIFEQFQKDSSVVNDEYLNLSFYTGGSDSKINYWIDCTAEKEIEELMKKEDLINKEEDLRIVTENKSYLDAMTICIELNHKRDFFRNFKKFIDEHIKVVRNSIYSQYKTDKEFKNIHDFIKTNNDKTFNIGGINLFSQKDVDNGILEIIENRRILEKMDYYSNEKLNTYDISFLTNELKNVLKKDKAFIFEVIRDYNIKPNDYIYSQILLNVILKTTKVDEIINKRHVIKSTTKLYKKEESKEEELMTKGFADLFNSKDEKLDEEELNNDRKKLNFIENFSIIKSYTDKHVDRINKDITSSYMLEFLLESLMLVPN